MTTIIPATSATPVWVVQARDISTTIVGVSSTPVFKAAVKDKEI